MPGVTPLGPVHTTAAAWCPRHHTHASEIGLLPHAGLSFTVVSEKCDCGIKEFDGGRISRTDVQRRLLFAARYHVPVMSPPGTSCGWLFRHLRISLLLPLSPHRTTKNRVDARTAVETHVPLRVAGRGGGRRRCVQGCAQPGAAGAKTNHATQNRRKHKRPE